MKPYNDSLKCGRLTIRWGLILFLCCQFIMPDTIMALEEDPYRYTTIGLRLDLTYTGKDSHNSSNNTTETSRGFEQRYSLDVKGLVVNPNLMTYKAGVEFVDSDTTGTSGDWHNRVDKYVLGSSILRKSRIPLTLAASRSVSDTTFGGDTTTDNYGVDWYLKFRTLPWTRLTFDKTKTQSSGIDQDIEFSNIAISKAVGQTSNSLNYSVTNTSENFSNYDSHNNVLSVKNDTNLPLNTNFNLGLVRNDFYDDSHRSNTTAGSVGMKSEPVDGLTQKFNYTLTDASSDSNGLGTDNTNESFSGRVQYNPIKSLKMFLDMQKTQSENSGSNSDLSEYTSSSGADNFAGSVSYRPLKNLNMFMDARSSLRETSNSETYDTTTKEVNFLSGAGHTHTITRELSATESLNYSKEEASDGDPLTGKTGRTILDANGALNYAKGLSWAALSAGALLGFHQETVEPGGTGEGAGYGYNAGLSGIRTRHFTLGTNYNYNGIYSISNGDVDRKEQTLSSNAVGSHGERLPLTVSHVYHTVDSYLDGEDGVENTVEVSGRMLYINKLPVVMTYRYYTLSRPDSIPPELQYIYIKEKIENSFESTVDVLHLKWLPIKASYKHHSLLQPYETPTLELSEDQQYYHTEEQNEESIGLSTSLIYFRKTSASASLGYSAIREAKLNTSTGLTEETGYRKRSLLINGSHNTTLLRGMFGLSTGYQASITNNITQDVREYYSTININGTYDKRMSRNMMLKLAAGQSFSDSNGALDSQLTSQVNIFYKLRAWFFSAEYQHAVKKRETSGDTTVTEDKFMLKASRRFVRII